MTPTTDPADPSLARETFEVSHLTGSFTLRSGAVSDQYFE